MVNARAARLLSNCQKFFGRMRRLPKILRKACKRHGSDKDEGFERTGAKGRKHFSAQENGCCKLVSVTKFEDLEPWETFKPTFQSTPRRASMVPIKCTVGAFDWSQNSSLMDLSNEETVTGRKHIAANLETDAEIVNQTLENQIGEEVGGTKAVHETPGEYEATSLRGTVLGAVFGATIESQEQSLQQPGVPHVLVVLLRKLEVLRVNSAALYKDSPMSLSIYTKMHLLNAYPIDDLVRMRPDIFEDARDLVGLVLRYVDFLPQKLIEGMDVWRSAILPLVRDGCIPDTTVDIDLKYRQEVTCLRFTAFHRSDNVIIIQGNIGANFSTLDHLFLHFNRVWEASAHQLSPEEVVRLFTLLSCTLCGQTGQEIVQVIFDFINEWPHTRRIFLGDLQNGLLAADTDP